MHPATRPSAILAVVISLLHTTACCGDTTVEPFNHTDEFEVTVEGLVARRGNLDPMTQEGCEALCTSRLFLLEAPTVHMCVATLDSTEPDASEDTGDTGDTGDNRSGRGKVQIDCIVSGFERCVGGRYSAALQARASGRGADPVAAWLAREACGEAGSVIAFRRLARELEALGAPASLVARARSAMRDEVVHARMVGDLARARGGSPDRVAEAPLPLRSLEELALENAVEGCVHETFAAARASWQASYASDPSVRSLSAVLAADEAAHADLAADVHAWACSVLPPPDAQRVEAARRRAWAQLAANPAPVDATSARALGLPDATAHRRIVGALIEALAA
jgi:hypothetical protein